MMIAHVYIEYTSLSLNRTFTYRFDDPFCVRGVRVQVPFGSKHLIGFVDHVEEVDEAYVQNQRYAIKSIDKVLDQIPLISEELFQLAAYMSDNCIASMISCFQVILPAKLKPRSGKHQVKKETWVVYDHDDETITEKQRIALEALKKVKEMRKRDWVSEYKSVTKKLIDAGLVVEVQQETRKILSKHASSSCLFTLSEEQDQAISKISANMHHQIVLLHGATGSGKTEVYLRLAQMQIEQGKQVLILVPEISLTPQMVKRVEERFGMDVAIYHSALNDQEKYEQFQLVKEGRVHIVVGTRSAIFMPFSNLGLIVLDEEHDQSYKQDSSPRYHCRDAAIWRGRYHDCTVLLASATPSLESYARAYKNVYQLVEMPSRINHNFPKVKMVEMRSAMKAKENYILSNVLKEAMKERLDAQEQIILLLNRRGYTPILRCVSCGHVEMCPHCDIAMSYHKDDHVLKCHTCGYQKKLPDTCPDCHEHAWRYLGFGTQRLAEVVKEAFPDAHIVRMDADTTSRKHAHEQLLTEFEAKGDILLGTQMIAKGLDFDRVTLVGIVNGDAMLNRSDYRCCELTFDLLAQACGRSGRGSRIGEVIIQGYDINHYALTCAAQHDYQKFFLSEMAYRHLAKYPPYAYISSILLAHKDQGKAGKEAIQICAYIKEHHPMQVLGPGELLKIKDDYRYRILLKSKDREYVKQCMHEVLRMHQKQKMKSRLELDMDPLVLE